jgi:predicted PurR-regulated permease PerM
MGIGIVLLFWAVIGTILAGVAAVVLGVATAWLTRRVQHWRRTAILAAAVLPFLCLAWAGAVFFFQAIVNETLFHRDPGLGDAWHTPLPNGYSLLMIDETDHGSCTTRRRNCLAE